jgi:hypothetical protein
LVGSAYFVSGSYPELDGHEHGNDDDKHHDKDDEDDDVEANKASTKKGRTRSKSKSKRKSQRRLTIEKEDVNVHINSDVERAAADDSSDEEGNNGKQPHRKSSTAVNDDEEKRLGSKAGGKKSANSKTKSKSTIKMRGDPKSFPYDAVNDDDDDDDDDDEHRRLQYNTYRHGADMTPFAHRTDPTDSADVSEITDDFHTEEGKYDAAAAAAAAAAGSSSGHSRLMSPSVDGTASKTKAGTPRDIDDDGDDVLVTKVIPPSPRRSQDRPFQPIQRDQNRRIVQLTANGLSAQGRLWEKELNELRIINRALQSQLIQSQKNSPADILEETEALEKRCLQMEAELNKMNRQLFHASRPKDELLGDAYMAHNTTESVLQELIDLKMAAVDLAMQEEAVVNSVRQKRQLLAALEAAKENE